MAAEFKIGDKVKLKVTNPPCCGFGNPQKPGRIIKEGRSEGKWQVQFDCDAKPIDVREEDLLSTED